jgi:uncharacterized protein (TIGR01777 family)
LNITISGASGLIGRRLLKLLPAEGHRLHVLSRHAGTNLPAGIRLSAWDPARGEPPAESLREADAVIHLAGEPVAQRWTPAVKQKIRDSRVEGTRNLVLAMSKLATPPRTLVCASAIGYYGARGDEVLTESSAAGSDFLSELCAAWEKAARDAEPLGVRVVSVRIGLVLDGRGGALARMLPPFKMGVGGRIGNGRQWMSWIHLADLAELFRFALMNPVTGPVNGVAPNPVTNAEFTRALGKAVGRPAFVPVPPLALKLLFGEMSDVLLSGQRVLPKAAGDAGFRFQFAEVGAALADCLK